MMNTNESLVNVMLSDKNEPTREELIEAEAEISSGDIELNVDDSNNALTSLKLYINEIRQFPLLTAAEELELGRIIQEGGDGVEIAKEKLINSNLRLGVFYAKKYLGRGVDLEDLITMANDGIMKAAEKYDYTKGFRFSTYAYWWIAQSITRGIADEGRVVRVPVHMSETMNQVAKAKKEFYQENHCEPSVQEICEITGLSEAVVKRANNASYMFNVEHYDDKITDESENSKVASIVDTNAVDPCEAVAKQSMLDDIHKALDGLSEKEKKVIMFRYGIGVNRTYSLEEISNMPEFGVTRERVRQIQEKAERKLSRVPSLIKLFKDHVA